MFEMGFEIIPDIRIEERSMANSLEQRIATYAASSWLGIASAAEGKVWRLATTA